MVHNYLVFIINRLRLLSSQKQYSDDKPKWEAAAMEWIENNAKVTYYCNM
jgi:hypothetical protein